MPLGDSMGRWPRNLTVLLFLIVTAQPLGGGAWITWPLTPRGGLPFQMLSQHCPGKGGGCGPVFQLTEAIQQAEK